MSGRGPVERSHGKMIVGTLTNGELIAKILERIKTMGGIEFFVVLPVASLNLAVVSWGKGLGQFVPDPQTPQFSFEGGRFVSTPWQQTICKFRSVISLHALDRIRESFYHMLKKPLG